MSTDNSGPVSSSGALQGLLGFFGLSSFYNPYGDDPTLSDKLDELKAQTAVQSAKLSMLSLQLDINKDRKILDNMNSTINFINYQGEYLFQTGKFAKQEISFISSLAMLIIVLVVIFFAVTK